MANKNCPYCNEPMEEGSIFGTSSGRMWWLPFGTHVSYFSIGASKKLLEQGAVWFKKDIPGLAAEVDCHYCRKCNKFIISGDDVGVKRDENYKK